MLDLVYIFFPALLTHYKIKPSGNQETFREGNLTA